MQLFAALYLDEDVDVLAAKLLIARGFDVITARDIGRLSTPDLIHLQYASSLNRCLLTHNRSDFESLHKVWLEAELTHAGIMIASRRVTHELARRVAVILDSLTADEIAGQLLYV